VGDDGLTEISYSQLSHELEQDNVALAEVDRESAEVSGELRRSTTIDEREVTRFRSQLPFDDPAPFVARLEERNVPISGKTGNGAWTTLLMYALPWILIIGFWLFLSRQMRQGGQQAFSFGRISAKTVAAERPDIGFDDVAGADEAKAELKEIIEFLKDPSRFRSLGARLPKGVLLIGPPGTGKTLLAQAVAGEAEVPFFSISGSDFVEMFVGVGAARVRNLFEEGKKNAPCIIFIDELDAVGRLRGAGLGGGHDEREQTLNQLLVELDGFEPNTGVILLSATNRPDVLDPALLRPGRFDRHVVVDMPDVRGREMILKVHARKIPLASDVDLGRLARGSSGLTGADLANLVNEAALLAARKGKEQVDGSDFEDANDKIMLGVERKSLVLTEDERRLTAYHEAGHALLTVLIPKLDPLHKVTIVPHGRAIGVTLSLPEEDRRSFTRAYLSGRLVVAYGGRVAEELVFGPENVTTGAAQDFQQATDLARRMVTQFGMSEKIGPITIGEEEELVFLAREVAHRHHISDHTAQTIDTEIQCITRSAYREATTMLQTHIDELHALAAALLERETLGREEVESVVAGIPLAPDEPEHPRSFKKTSASPPAP
jgi:cell division protease FtsH